jgi:hypothetical protein
MFESVFERRPDIDLIRAINGQNISHNFTFPIRLAAIGWA